VSVRPVDVLNFKVHNRPANRYRLLGCSDHEADIATLEESHGTGVEQMLHTEFVPVEVPGSWQVANG
jgi:hypothetical protein